VKRPVNQTVTRRDLSERADRLRTLLVFTVLQAFLVTVNLRLLPMWSEEARALNWAVLWLKLTGATDPLWSLRLCSAVCAIGSTVLLERLWLRKVSAEAHQWVLLLWAFSPGVLLYGRMAQSYSLQTLLTIVAVWAVLRFTEDFTSWKRLAALVVSLTALLYTQYQPGLAVWIAANILLLKVGRTPRSARDPLVPFWRTFLLPNLLVAAAFIPKLLSLPHAPRDIYSLTRNAFLEPLLKLAYGFYSLAFGEAIPIWLLALTAILVVPYIWILVRAARNHRQWLWPAATLALLAYIGAAYWFAYPFMGAHLLFLLPLLMLAVATGIEESGRLGLVFGVALFAAQAGGVWYYFEARDMINIAYLTPNRQMAATIALHSLPANTMVWVDGLNLDATIFGYYLPVNFPLRVLRSPADADAASNEVERNPAILHVWFIRNDDSFDQLEKRMTGNFHYHALHPYVAAPATYRLGLRYVMHEPEAPRYIYQVWEFRR
jgi:hypothetical protein